VAAKILVMDDSEIILAVTQSTLSNAGFQVFAATTLAELDQQIEHGPFDLVLLDVQMPEQEGDEIGDVLRHSLGDDSRIYLYSSLPDDELEARCKLAGLDGYIHKDDGAPAMLEAVKRALAIRRM
jgi:CheY-like chemotaxis protein